LIETLRAHAADPIAYDAFVEQWFFDVAVPRYRIRDAEICPVDSGWRVAATVENSGSGNVPVELVATRGRRCGCRPDGPST